MAHQHQKPLCQKCSQPLIWAPDVRQWYCNSCQKYLDSAYSGKDIFDKLFDPLDNKLKGKVYRCTACGNVMSYIPQYQKYYCYSCQQYL